MYTVGELIEALLGLDNDLPVKVLANGIMRDVDAVDTDMDDGVEVAVIDLTWLEK